MKRKPSNRMTPVWTKVNKDAGAMFDLKSFFEDKRHWINLRLERYLRELVPSDIMFEPVSYSLLGNGKRLRPVLCLTACSAVGGDQTDALPAACALEMIHTYSLIHDDLPALDNDDLRRGRPTCHKAFDEATAILAGDALLTMAFEVLSHAGCDAAKDRAGCFLKVIATISAAAGCRGMIEGQARDIAFEGAQLSRQELQQLHLLKTGALIRASVISGALLGNATSEKLQHFEKFALSIGLAFQVMDDILNVSGDPQKLGKAVGTDQLRQKNTYPALLGLEAAQAHAWALIDDALAALESFDERAEPLRAIARYVVERKR